MPTVLSTCCASLPNAAPIVTYSNPSAPNASRDPLVPADLPRKIGWTFESVPASYRARSTARRLCRRAGVVPLAGIRSPGWLNVK